MSPEGIYGEAVDYCHKELNLIYPVITRPTRVTQHSSAVKDHILISTILTKNISSGNVKTTV